MMCAETTTTTTTGCRRRQQRRQGMFLRTMTTTTMTMTMTVMMMLCMMMMMMITTTTTTSAFVPPQQQQQRQQQQQPAAPTTVARRFLSATVSPQEQQQDSSTKHVKSKSSTLLLHNADPVLAQFINQEEYRQRAGLELIASENFCSAAVRACLGSCLTNKYSEGNVGKRYYGGNEFIDEIETLCMQRALQVFNINPAEWGVNVQPYSGSPANFAVYTALLQPHDRLMGLDLPSGGHLTHGFRTATKKVSATSVYFESLPYVVSSTTGYIDYDEMEKRAKMFLPKLLIAGGSAYPREWEYARMRQIADSVGALLMVDMAHISGLVAANVVDSPFKYADIVTSTTHKTLRGPRSGIIFAKKQYMDAINAAVFPSLQGGPHNHQIAALATALHEASQPSFQEYGQQVVKNAQALAQRLVNVHGHELATGGTDNHLILWKVKPVLTGSKMEKVLELASITTNKNAICGDTSALNPGGVRLGTPALTSRGFKEADFEQVADFLHRGWELAIQAQEIAAAEQAAAAAADGTPTKAVSLAAFLRVVQQDEKVIQGIQQLKQEVETFALSFPMPGYDDAQ